MNNIAAGSEIPFQSHPAITQAQLRAYADASGDQNPIHLDEEVAKSVGLPGVIAHGMLTAGFIGERAKKFVSQETGLSSAILKKIQIRFKSMTLLGDVISVGGAVKGNSESEITLELQARNQRGEVTTTGIAIFSIGVV